jgi:hypothetical protein
MLIHKNFIGGNIKVVSQNDNDVYVENELRDTQGDWFYWAFCVENACGKTITFHFQDVRLGFYGPAVSHDLKEWRWLNDKGENEFTYTFGENENKVYFAHSMLYHPDRFLRFASAKSLDVEEFCKSQKGRSLPCVKFGSGERSIVLTSRHHACESTGNYVLEGLLEELIEHPIENAKILCVPFVDYDGVVDGDQGKGRAPWDHNRDYDYNVPSIYEVAQKIKEYVAINGCYYAFDFHAPWHWGEQNDKVFIVHKSFEQVDRVNAFGKIFEESITEGSVKYSCKDNYEFGKGWNTDVPSFARYMLKREENELAFTLETTYFGLRDNVVSQEKMIELGRCFARALKRYIVEKEGKNPLVKA